MSGSWFCSVVARRSRRELIEVWNQFSIFANFFPTSVKNLCRTSSEREREGERGRGRILKIEIISLTMFGNR